MAAKGEEIVPEPQPGLVLGAGQYDANINHVQLLSGDWWKPMSDAEAEAFIDGRF
jgi:hypothetical protein